MSDYPRAMYHTAIKHRRNAFGKIVEGYVHDGDLVDPNFPKPEGQQRNTDIQISGKIMGPHLLEQKHYRTMLVGVYDLSSGLVDEAKSKAQEEELAKQGWVRHPSELKEEYEDD